MISSLIMSELIPAFFSCSNVFILSHNSLGSHGKNIVVIPEGMIACELGSYMSDLPLKLGRPIFLKSKFISSANSLFDFRCCRLE